MEFTFYNIGALIVAIAIPVAGGFIVSTVGGGDSEWFRQLDKPSWTPPNWVFPVMWTVLYVLMGIASWMIWKQGGFRGAAYPLGLYVFQLVLNFAWTPLFFGLHRPDLAFGEIILLWLAVVATTYFFFIANHTAGYLLIPYILWVTVAATLNGYIFLHNPLSQDSGYDITTPLRNNRGSVSA